MSECERMMRTLRAMDDAALAQLAGGLRLDYDENEASGEWLGGCLVVATERYIAAHAPGRAATLTPEESP